MSWRLAAAVACASIGPARLTALALLLGGGLLGCGGGTRTVIVQEPPAPAATGAAGTGVGGAAAGTGATASTATSAGGEAPSRYAHLAAFQTPTGNIGCMIVSGLARCDIVRRAWQTPPRPSGCPPIVDFGQGLEVAASGNARVVCAGDTVREPASPKLAYGTATRIGPFACVSRATGLTCTNGATGHGFMLSIQRYQLF